MEARTNMEISLSSCCSLTFSGTQLALNAEIIIIPITQANSVTSLCAETGEGEGREGISGVLGGDTVEGGPQQKETTKGGGLMLLHTLYISLFMPLAELMYGL